MGWTVARCQRPSSPPRPLAMPISVVHITTPKPMLQQPKPMSQQPKPMPQTEETSHVTASDLGQTAHPALTGHVSRVGRTAPAPDHYGTHFRGAPGTPGGSRDDGAGGSAAPQSLAESEIAPDLL